MLAIVARAETRLQKCIRGQCSTSRSRLEIPEMAKVMAVGVLGVWKIVAGQRRAVVAIDRPIQFLIRQPAEDARAGEHLDVIIEVALRGTRGRERAIGDRLSG